LSHIRVPGGPHTRFTCSAFFLGSQTLSSYRPGCRAAGSGVRPARPKGVQARRPPAGGSRVPCSGSFTLKPSHRASVAPYRVPKGNLPSYRPRRRLQLKLKPVQGPEVQTQTVNQSVNQPVDPARRTRGEALRLPPRAQPHGTPNAKKGAAPTPRSRTRTPKTPENAPFRECGVSRRENMHRGIPIFG